MRIPVLVFVMFSFTLAAQVSVPYINNFEGPAATTGWSHYALSGTDDWELGQPSTFNFTSAFSGDSAWVTNLDGMYASNSVRVLETPDFDLTNTSVDYAFVIYNKREKTGSGGQFLVEYSINSGASWLPLFNSGMNKKNWQTSTGFASNAIGAFQESVTSLSWIQGNIVRFRFKATATTGSGQGWMIDDFMIKEAEYNVAAGQGDTIFNVNKHFTTLNVESPVSFQNQYTLSYPFQFDYYLSTDPVLNVGDFFMGSAVENLSNSNLTLTNSFTMPAGLNAGTYYIIYEMDALNILDETSETDNSNYTVMIVDSIYVGNYTSDFDTLMGEWTSTNYGNSNDWYAGVPNNWQTEFARSDSNALISPAYISSNQYIESPYLDLSTTTNTTVCFWYRSAYYGTASTIPIYINYPNVDQPSVTYPVFLTGSTHQVLAPRLYTWDCFCKSMPQLDGEISTKIRIKGGTDNAPMTMNNTIIDDIYIGAPKPDAAIEGFKENRFTSSVNSIDTLYYYFFNSGLTTLPSTTTSFYWSSDSLLDGGDLFLGSKTENAMLDTSFEATFFEFTKPTLAEGVYYIHYVVDDNDDVAEMREQDNTDYFVIHQSDLESLPYFNDFETQVNHWRHNSTFGSDVWNWTEPEGDHIDTAFSGTKAWVSNDSGFVPTKSRMHLYTPVFDLTELTHPVMEFDLLNYYYGVDGYNYWPYNMGNMMYSVDGGSTWLTLDSTNLSFKRWYYRMELETITGKDRIPINGSADPESDLLYGKNLKAFHCQIAYSTRDYDDNTHYVLDLEFLKDYKEVQFMMVYANHDSPMEGMMMDNFEITEARIDLMVPTNKNLMVDKDDAYLKFYFKLANNENYISDATTVNVYCSEDTILSGSDVLLHTEHFARIRPFYKDIASIEVATPTGYGNYNFVLLEIDPDNLNAESVESNNVHYLPLGMDSCENYSYPMLFEFEELDINGWTWYHDSTGYQHGHRFRTRLTLQDPTIDAADGEWFLDPIDMLGYSNSNTPYPIHMLETPAFDFGGMNSLTMSFDFFCLGDNLGTSTGTQGGNMEFSTDGGATWTVLTASLGTGATNWFNLSDIESLNNEPGWGDLPGPLSWTPADYNLGFLAGEENVRFRFKFKSEQQYSGTSPMGFRLDNFLIDGDTTDLVAVDVPGQITGDIQTPTLPVGYTILSTSSDVYTTLITNMYWSEDSIFDTSDILVSSFTNNTITQGTSYFMHYLNYPTPVSQDNYWIFYAIDATNLLPETSESNNLAYRKVYFDNLSVGDNSIHWKSWFDEEAVYIKSSIFPSDELSFCIYNSIGQKVVEIVNPEFGSNEIYSIKTADLAPGVYLLHVYNGESGNVMKFVVN
jgi:hypothetical protein